MCRKSSMKSQVVAILDALKKKEFKHRYYEEVICALPGLGDRVHPFHCRSRDTVISVSRQLSVN